MSDPNFIGFDKYRRDGAYHWSELAASDDYRGKIEAVAARAHRSDRCLDIGCGDGAYAFALSTEVDMVVGVDADFHAVKLANQELSKRGVENVRCHQLPISELTLDGVDAAAPFDLIYSMDVIEHLPDPDQLLERAVAVAASDARILIGTPLYLGDDLVSPYHVHEYEQAELLALVERHVDVEEVLTLPMMRLDGAVHPDGFVVAVCRPR
jgi:2-polyprenyl-3-methyl-5-hydroxy-6-metoxy-1,4-benzoquinol methylase